MLLSLTFVQFWPWPLPDYLENIKASRHFYIHLLYTTFVEMFRKECAQGCYSCKQSKSNFDLDFCPMILKMNIILDLLTMYQVWWKWIMWCSEYCRPTLRYYRRKYFLSNFDLGLWKQIGLLNLFIYKVWLRYVNRCSV